MAAELVSEDTVPLRTPPWPAVELIEAAEESTAEICAEETEERGAA